MFEFISSVFFQDEGFIECFEREKGRTRYTVLAWNEKERIGKKEKD